MATRLNRRQPTSSLFADYPGSAPTSRPSSLPPQSQGRSASPYTSNLTAGSVNAYPYSHSHSQTHTPTPGLSTSLFGTKSSHNSPLPTHNKPNPYTSTAVLEHLEAQNQQQQITDQTSVLSSKVSQLKQLSIAIGEEIRESSSLADAINTQFEGASVKLKGTMRRMLRMAERTGVGWKVWLLFFAAVWALFVYVWLF